MSSKLGLLLSTVFLMAVFLMGADLTLLNATFQQVDGIAMVVAHRISMDGGLQAATVEYVKSQGATFTAITEGAPAIGDTYTFAVERSYAPLILKKSPIEIRVTRSCVVGFYRPDY